MRKVVVAGVAVTAAVVLGVSAAYAGAEEHSTPATPRVSTSASSHPGDDGTNDADHDNHDGATLASPAPSGVHHDDDADDDDSTEHTSPASGRTHGDDDTSRVHGTPAPTVSQRSHD